MARALAGEMRAVSREWWRRADGAIFPTFRAKFRKVQPCATPFRASEALLSPLELKKNGNGRAAWRRQAADYYGIKEQEVEGGMAG